jgi:poly(A) polymerase Pap1
MPSHVNRLILIIRCRQIDFLFATLDKAVIPEDLDLLDEANLKNLDEKSVLSLNGTCTL